MLYLLDANVLIGANERYYPFESIPQFWVWLVEVGEAGQAKVPREIYLEVQPSPGPFKEWLTAPRTKAALILDETVDQSLLNDVIRNGYAPDLDDAEITRLGQDPFLITYARIQADRTVVTQEGSRPSAQRAKRKVPDVCDGFGVPWVDAFTFYRRLDFNTRKG